METKIVDRALYMSQKLGTLSVAQKKEFSRILNTDHDATFDEIFSKVTKRIHQKPLIDKLNYSALKDGDSQFIPLTCVSESLSSARSPYGEIRF